ncbi:unnamed protein product [Polarella glacialis]|uniref:Uncharacterized protein n=1 Tax=Polarella glacialis TaxID=89957 RepID=A0A813GN18_POLGL|nr:unnamed protein product [Polarella glacialis]
MGQTCSQIPNDSLLEAEIKLEGPLISSLAIHNEEEGREKPTHLELKASEATPSTCASDGGVDFKQGAPTPNSLASPASLLQVDTEPEPLTVDSVIGLCTTGRTMEAVVALEQLELQVSSGARSPATQDSASARLAARLRDEPVLQRLRAIRDRRATFLHRLAGPAWKEGENWATIELRDPNLGDHFRLQMQIRFANTAERDPHVASSQLIIGTKVFGFPMPLPKLIAFQSQVDLMQKEWLKDCSNLVGKPGGSDKLFTSFLTSVLAPKMLPWKLEEFLVRDFVVSEEALPINEARPGVTTMESSPADSLNSYFGVEIPKPRRGMIRLSGSEKMNHFMPGLAGPEYTDCISSVRISVPLNSWLVPLSLVKPFLADIFAGTLKTVKKNVIDDWDNLEFEKRMVENSDFFNKIQAVVDTQTKKLASVT